MKHLEVSINVNLVNYWVLTAIDSEDPSLPDYDSPIIKSIRRLTIKLFGSNNFFDIVKEVNQFIIFILKSISKNAQKKIYNSPLRRNVLSLIPVSKSISSRLHPMCWLTRYQTLSNILMEVMVIWTMKNQEQELCVLWFARS